MYLLMSVRSSDFYRRDNIFNVHIEILWLEITRAIDKIIMYDKRNKTYIIIWFHDTVRQSNLYITVDFKTQI